MKRVMAKRIDYNIQHKELRFHLQFMAVLSVQNHQQIKHKVILIETI